MAAKLELLETRVSRLEADLRDLRRVTAAKDSRPWYEQILGTFDDDPGFDEMVRLGKEIRDSDQGDGGVGKKKRSVSAAAKSVNKKGRR